MTYSVGNNVWMGGEWVYLTKAGDYFYYQKGFGAGKHEIECLSEYRYCYSEIWFDNVAVEGKKLIGILSVSKDSKTGYNLYQEEIEEDVLFEVDLQNNSSRIIYNTGNNKTRIIGYREGMIYLLKDGVIYEEEIKKETREELLDLREEDFYRADTAYRRTFNFYWQGDSLIIWTYSGGEIKVKSITI